MYHKETNSLCVPRAWNLSDDLGQIEYLFSDKTGTLTRNVMEFRRISVAGKVYGYSEAANAVCPAAIAAAFHDATGIHARRIPLTPAYVTGLLKVKAVS